jgi:hypothetical protein
VERAKRTETVWGRKIEKKEIESQGENKEKEKLYSKRLKIREEGIYK